MNDLPGGNGSVENGKGFGNPGLRGHGLFTAGLLLAALASCTAVGPDFVPPRMEMPAKWAEPVPAPSTVPAGLQDLAEWWRTFGDPTLISLEERAVRANLDLLLAEARIRQARAARGVAASGLGPSVEATTSYRRIRSPGIIDDQGNTIAGGVSDLYQAGFDAGWELDLFGGVRRSIEAAEADLLAAVESRREVLVTLTAEVALNYVDLRTFQTQIVIARQNLAAQEKSAEITRQRFAGGFASGLDVANAEAQVATTASDIPLLEAAARQTIHNLGVLLGREPEALIGELSPAAGIPAASPAVPVGVPSDLLRQRPDIRQAEAEIHAATARIGVATADLFPKFSISGAFGFQGSAFDSWLNWFNRLWSIGPSMSWEVFSSGRVRSGIEEQKAIEEQTLLAYRQTVLTALQEVEDALIASAKEEERRRSLAAAVASNRKAADLANKLYVEGQTDFLSVLVAERALYNSQDALARSTQNVSVNLISLYKALGGGWGGEAETWE